ncbi:MAG: Crp/Fnr family transcriptional regulator [Acidimicrobiales bacterium]
MSDPLDADPGSFHAALRPAEIEVLRTMSTSQRFRRGATLFLEGEAADRVLVIEQGRTKIVSMTPDGREVVLAIRGPGDLLGEFAAVDGLPRSAAAIAIEDMSALVVPAERFAEFLTKHPTVTYGLLQMVVSRLRDSVRKQVEFGAHDATGRVAQRLVELAERYGREAGNGIQIDLPLTQEELAGFTGSSREAVSRALRVLRGQGLVETNRMRIVVVDIEGLRLYIS